MSKVVIKRLDSVTKNDTTATEQINDNFQALQQAIENTVSRDGTVPNYMDADLDLNSYRIINAGDPVNKHDVVTLKYFEEKAGGAIEAAAEAKASASKAASSAQSALVASNNAIGQLAQAEGLLTAAEGQLADTKQYVDATKADINQTVEDSIEYVEQEAVKAATEVVGSVVGQYTDRAETAAKNAEADASRTAESANQASASATSAATSASEAEAIAEEISVYNFKNKITNCITEIPQDIKLELNNGVLTLKAGSKVYVPNGAGKFDKVVISSDKTATRTDSQDCMAWYNTGTGTVQLFPVVLFYSGSTAPTDQKYMFWYDTANNLCKVTSDSGAIWVTGKTFPLCLVATDGSKISGIKQVFNGFGYIGSTVFALPGVKGLIPNGRNADGTLNNKEFVIEKVKINSRTVHNQEQYNLYLSNQDYGNTKEVTYDAETNFNKWDNGSGVLLSAHVGEVMFTSSGISWVKNKLPFRAVDQNDFNKLDEEAVKTSGNQTIGGTKDFSSSCNFRSSVYFGSQKDASNPPTSGNTYPVTNWFRDKTGTVFGTQDVYKTSQDVIGHRLNVRRAVNGVNKHGEVGVEIDNTGTVVGRAPTPVTTSNTTHIATTAWVTSNGTKNSFKPNWAGKVSISPNTNYTAPSNGFLAFCGSTHNRDFTLTINSVKMFNYKGNVIAGFFSSMPLCKGDIANLSNDSNAVIYFVPFK